MFPAETYDSYPGIGGSLREVGWYYKSEMGTDVRSRVGHDDDFEDEVCFKRGRVVTPQFLNPIKYDIFITN